MADAKELREADSALNFVLNSIVDILSGIYSFN